MAESKALFFFEGGTPFFRCAVCREHRKENYGGTILKLGNEIEAIVCMGTCERVVRDLVQKHLPDALPTIDEHARLVR